MTDSTPLTHPNISIDPVFKGTDVVGFAWWCNKDGCGIRGTENDVLAAMRVSGEHLDGHRRTSPAPLVSLPSLTIEEAAALYEALGVATERFHGFISGRALRVAERFTKLLAPHRGPLLTTEDFVDCATVRCNECGTTAWGDHGGRSYDEMIVEAARHVRDTHSGEMGEWRSLLTGALSPQEVQDLYERRPHPCPECGIIGPGDPGNEDHAVCKRRARDEEWEPDLRLPLSMRRRVDFDITDDDGEPLDGAL